MSQSRNQRTVLLIDDSSEDREFYRRYLLQDEDYEYTILEAKSGQTGLKQWQDAQPDIVVLDYRLPDLDGLEVLTAFQKQRHHAFLPVVMVTGQGDETTAVQAMKAGALDYLVKEQLTPAGLRLAIHAAIETVQLRTQLQQSQEREHLVAQISQHIHKSLDLQEILQTTVTEVRQLLQSDRVLIFQLESQGRGHVVVESVGAEWMPLLSTTYHDPCLDDVYLQPYRQGLVVARADIYAHGTDPCYLELLSQLQVRANLVVPIVNNDLWGMLIVHQCAAPRQWQPFEIELLKQLATQVGIAVQQAELYAQAQRELAVREQVEASLRLAYEDLELRIQERTQSLLQTNAQLQQEIHDRKQAEEQQAFQASLLNQVQNAVIATDLEGQVTYWNKFAQQLYQLIPEDMGREILEVIVPVNQPEITSQIMVSIQTKRTWDGELEVQRRDGSSFTTYIIVSLLHDQADNPYGIVGISMDITAQKQLEVQFLRAQRLESLGTLASRIAHDMNNILTPMNVSAHLLSLKLQNLDAKSQQLVQVLVESSKRAADLMKQILTFARGSDGERSLLQIRQLIEELEPMLRSGFSSSIEIILDIPTDLWMVSADSTQLHQVLMNLCVNARDAMPNGGTLSITAENCEIDELFVQMHLEAQVGSYVVLTIADTGIGIPSEVIERMFEPFFTTKAIGKGTGLGLSTVLGIIKSHGGFVDVSSKVGRGSLFKIYLPGMMDTHHE